MSVRPARMGAGDYFIRERRTIDNPFSCFITANTSQRCAFTNVYVLLVLWTQSMTVLPTYVQGKLLKEGQFVDK